MFTIASSILAASTFYILLILIVCVTLAMVASMRD